jgi:hypothetical protein
MRFLFACFVLLVSLEATGQQTDTTKTTTDSTSRRTSAFKKHSWVLSASVGFADWYRDNYTLPGGYEKGTTSGFSPLYMRLEYAVSKHFGVGGTFIYDAFDYNYSKNYTGNNGPFTRFETNAVRIAAGGLTLNYHFGSVIPVKNLDVYIAAGVNLNNIRYSAKPQGDTTAIVFSHPLTGTFKAGARYYFGRSVNVFAEGGYDQQTIVDVGFGVRFRKKR